MSAPRSNDRKNPADNQPEFFKVTLLGIFAAGVLDG